jgi:hypothetical protein
MLHHYELTAICAVRNPKDDSMNDKREVNDVVQGVSIHGQSGTCSDVLNGPSSGIYL